jgi:hypothetical protein
LFCREWVGREPVFFLPEQRDRIDAARRALRELPAEPSWGDYGAGLEWGSDVARQSDVARERIGAEQAPF